MLKMFKWLFNEPKKEDQENITYKVRSLLKMNYVTENVTCEKGDTFNVTDKDQLNYLMGDNPTKTKYVELIETKEEK